MYVKRHPVPFGEYIPLRGARRGGELGKANLVTQDMVAGTGNGLLRGGPVADRRRDLLRGRLRRPGAARRCAAGAQLLVVQTNNATFGHTAETYQQLAMSRLRAVETRPHRGAGVDERQVGRHRTGRRGAPRSGALFTPDVLVATVPLRTSTTLATRLGADPGVACWSGLALVAAAVVGAVRRLAAERSPPDGPTSGRYERRGRSGESGDST